MNSIDLTFAALADPTRRAIVARLARGEATVGELAKPFRISAPAISRHLKVLEEASLISNKRQGKHRLCRLNLEALTNASEWIESQRHFWIQSFDRLEKHLKKKKGNQQL
jgi:DNA-binding transcriptional ArsR family regulator